MAHVNDLNAARAAAAEVTDPFDRAAALTQVAFASAVTDIAAAIEDFSYNYGKTIR